jgi:hypothetical protein
MSASLRWVDAKLDAEKLTVGTVALAKEISWRKHGRPIHEIEELLRKAIASVGDGDSLRQVSFVIG